MTLSSATDAELDAWANFAFVGKAGHGEYLQFKTATQVGPKTWQLTNLRRGRKGTDYALGTHAAGEEFCLLGTEGVFRAVYSDDSQWGSALTFRRRHLHEDVADAAHQAFTNTGEGKRPYSPVAMSPAAGTEATTRRSAGLRARASTPAALALMTSTILRSDHQWSRADTDGNRGFECRLYRR
jgi:hypothetical protein